MKLQVLSSSSSGSCYILQGDRASLIIEAGMPYKDLVRALNYNLSTVVGVIVSHQHKDHCGYLSEYVRHGIDAYLSYEAAEACSVLTFTSQLHFLTPRQEYKVGEFRIMPFELRHDVTNYGYLIEHPECGKICFITDTHYCPYKFEGLNQIIVECNYSEDKLQYNQLNGLLHPSLAKRIQRSHMGLRTTLGFLKANDLSKVNNIVLIHLSEGNADEQQIRQKVEQLAGRTPHIANRNMCIDFNQTPF